MTTVLERAPASASTTVAARIAHLAGVSEFVALCGKQLRGVPVSPDSDKCVVCLDLARRTFVAR